MAIRRPNTGDLPIYQSDSDILRSQGVSASWLLMPPRFVNSNSQVFAAVAYGAVKKRTIQNVGTTPVFYWLNMAAEPNYTSDTPHGILIGGATTLDGAGGQLDISNYPYNCYVGHPSFSINVLVFASYIPGFVSNMGQLYM